MNKYVHLVFVALSVLITVNTHSVIAAESKPLHAYAAPMGKSLVTLSPNGKLLAYRLNEQDKDIIAIVDLETNKLVRGFNVGDINPSQLYFINDDRLIIKVFERRRQLGYVGRYDVSNAFVFDIKDNDLSQLLTRSPNVHAGQTDFGHIISVSNDGKWAYMPAYAMKKTENTPRYSILKVNLDKPYKSARISTVGAEGVIDYFMGRNGKVLARERYLNESNMHYVDVFTKERKWRTIYENKTPYITRSFSGITADEQHIVVVDNNGKQGNNYFLMSLIDGKIFDAPFTQKNKEIERLLTDVNRVVYGVKYAGFNPSYTFFDKKIDKLYRELEKELPQSNITLTSFNQDKTQLITYVEWDGLVGDFISNGKGGLRKVLSAMPQFTWDDVNNVVEFAFKARDGVVIPTLLTVPNRALGSGDKLSAVVLPHGGPESHDKKTFNWLAQYLASRGHLVIQPQFRGSTGFGVEHTIKGRGEWGNKMQDDLTDAASALVKMGEIDKSRVCIIGSSYGGYAALAGAVFSPEVYRCVVAINGVADVALMMKRDRQDAGRDSWVVSYWQDVIGTEHNDLTMLDNISPVNFAHNAKAPILLIHATQDKVVDIEQSDLMFDALDDAKKEVSFVKIKGEGHQLIKEQSRLKVLQEIDKFLTEHLAK